MDKSTRNLIQKATQDARRLLETEFSEQLEGVFDILPDGTIAPEPGEHLNESQRIIRRKIVASILHKKAGGKSFKDKKGSWADQGDASWDSMGRMTGAEAVSAYVREAAFTYLNRFAALKMLEARGLVQECVSKGELSSGFKEFCGLAPGLAQLPDKGYRLYIESIFDELGTEIRVLFDRRDPASLLWPKALEELLSIINRDEIAGIWGEDETIGWVYQYFNSGEERKKMRDESAAPRNSRELAVRNQFFTPRYVVEFLTDNTLGRTWYEMQGGETGLKETCRYLVRRPNEVFLKKKEEAPPEDEKETENLSQEELLKKNQYIPFRAKKDPRDIKILDPACGSGHFLLYAFDLLLDIYEEGWQDTHAPKREETGRTLAEDYPEIENLKAAIPGLILKHNLHGIDIDPRAAQIAALSLWMRAQKAFSAFNIDRRKRPAIEKTNIVTAEPMPGEKDMLLDFSQNRLPYSFLRKLAEDVFDKMELAGEAGSLLKIEEEIRDAIAEAKAQKQAEKTKPKVQDTLFPQFDRPKQQQLSILDFADITEDTDDKFWEKAEGWIYDALKKYSGTARNGKAFQRRLFAKDTVRGFAFIDLCRKRYDAVLMNPPFGDASLPSKPYIEEVYGDTKGDVYKTFVECFEDRLVPAGMLGIISSRTGFFLSQSTDWRQRVVLRLYRPLVLADLGHGVLDAMVETAAYVLRSLTKQEKRELTLSLLPLLKNIPVDKSNSFSIPKYQKSLGGLKRHQAGGELESLKAEGFVEELPGGHRRFRATSQKRHTLAAPIQKPHFQPLECFRLMDESDKGKALAEVIHNYSDNRKFLCDPFGFSRIPGNTFAYWASHRLIAAFTNLKLFKDSELEAWVGLQTNQDFRWLRLWWEINEDVHKAPLEDDHQDEFRCWLPFAKGGIFAPIYCDIPLVVNWGYDGRFLKVWKKEQLRQGLITENNSQCWNESRYKRPGLTWPRRSQRGMSIRVMPQGCIFADKGPAAFVADNGPKKLSALLAIMNSAPFLTLISLQMAFGSYEVGVIQRTPVPELTSADIEVLATLSKRAWTIKRATDTACDTSHAAVLPALLQCDGDTLAERAVAWEKLLEEREEELAAIQAKIDELSYALYGIPKAERKAIASKAQDILETGTPGDDEDERENITPSSDPAEPVGALLSWLAGFSFGRFDVRLALDPALFPKAPEPFDPLPVCSAGMLTGPDGLPFLPSGQYPVSIALDGVLVDDPGFEGGQLHPNDIVLRAREVLEVLWKEKASDIEQEACEILKVPDLRSWFRKSFFSDHIRRYSKSRRKAPIYWQLATQSASYSVWLYYHRFTKDTFYKVLNEYVSPKLQFEERELVNLRQQCGQSPTATQRKEMADREGFVEELKTFREEVARIAPLWNPNLNDGVIINFAPLWRLVPQNGTWQKECRECWDKLVKGDYDWAHLSMHLWPERVVQKCATDRSLAIAHGLEEALWEEGDKGKWKPKEVSGETIEKLIRERTSPTVKSALDELFKAPVSAGMAGKMRKKRGGQA